MSSGSLPAAFMSRWQLLAECGFNSAVYEVCGGLTTDWPGWKRTPSPCGSDARGAPGAVRRWRPLLATIAAQVALLQDHLFCGNQKSLSNSGRPFSGTEIFHIHNYSHLPSRYARWDTKRRIEDNIKQCHSRP